MESLAQRARRVLQTRADPVVPLAEVVRLLRHDGCAVTEWILLRAMRADPGFRLLDPWRGPLAFLAEPPPAVRVEPRGSSTRDVDPRHVLVLIDDVSLPEPPPDAAGIRGRVRRSLVVLGRALDEHSLLERVRWLRMLSEAAHLGRI
jgi:hypothetical protein